MQSIKRLPWILQRTDQNIIFSLKALLSTTTSPKNVELKKWKDIPGPSSLPVIGQILHFIPGDRFVPGDLYKPTEMTMNDVLYNKYGPIVRIGGFFGLPRMVYIYDADMVEYILRSEDQLPNRPVFQSIEYYRKHYKKNKHRSTTGTGLVTDQGELWKATRSTVNPIMMNPKTIKLYSNTFDEVTEDFITRLRSIRRTDNMFDNFRFEINLWALESVSAVILGTRLNCFNTDIPDDSPIKRLVKSVHDVFYMSEELDLKPGLWRFISTPMFKKAMNIYEEQSNLIRYFMKNSIENLKTQPPKANEEKGVLEKLLEIDENVAINIGRDSLFAGIDTTANVLISALHFLATNQDKQNKLREELKSSEDNNLYLKACIKESLRLLPAVAANIRKASRDYNIMGYKLPKDMIMVVNHQTLCHLEENYPKAKEFIPERWIVGKSDPLHYGNAHKFAYSPFGFGTRSCVGRRIAQVEMEVFLSKIIQNFHIEWNGSPPILKTSVVNYFPGNLNFVLRDIAEK
ncbi:cytochrome P450 CYP12A2-like isoform X1 [Leptidea sinapis]|uniref:cytochrome P450 CYP12A2-like isoform X1 n=1 Tax=Leptidea sinapis TaxID=189913 RepID=UPI0021316E19|nr:cytochrome P450 CYP12A2-like isoform X1 [Leptidea sinapis]